MEAPRPARTLGRWASTTLRTSTTAAASPAWRAWTACPRTRRSRRAIDTLDNLEHRGAEGADAETGDGAGILTQIPDAFLRAEVEFALPEPGRYAVAVCMLPREADRREAAETVIERLVEDGGQRVLGWRDVPVDEQVPGSGARPTMPVIRQLFIGARRGRLRAPPVRHPPPGRARAGRRGLLLQLQLTHDGAQGDARRAAAPALLQGPVRPAVRVRAGDRPLALLDQHVPELVARAPVPLRRPQRRDQHAARERELDAGARARAGRVRRGAAGDPERRVGLRQLRRRPRAAGARGPAARARGDDDGAGGVGGPRRPARGAARVLRLPREDHGAVGRPGVDHVLRRADPGREAGPQRAPARPLAPDRRRLGGAGERDGRDAGRSRPGDQARAAEARRAVDRRPRPRPGVRRPRGGVRDRVAAAVRAVGERGDDPARGRRGDAPRSRSRRCTPRRCSGSRARTSTC